MQKFAPVIIIIILALGLWWIFDKTSNPEVTAPTTTTTEASTTPDPSNATFMFAEGPITLQNGESTETLVPGSALEQETMLTDDLAYGDLNADGKNDTIAVLVQAGGGSGVFVYVGGYISGPVNYKGTNTILLGDRIDPQSISINNAMATITYLDRGEGEALASEPTVQVTRRFIYNGSELVEVK